MSNFNFSLLFTFVGLRDVAKGRCLVVSIVLLAMSTYLTAVSAQTYRTVPSTEFIAEQIAKATTTIYLAAPTLTSLPVAEALRAAMVERDVTVNLITTSEGIGGDASTIPSLTLVGANTYVGAIPPDYFLLVLDSAVVASGPLVATMGVLGDDAVTTIVADQQNATLYADLLAEMMLDPAKYNFTLEVQ
jgi:hypothetical protein